ncbi:MAG: MBL fold metallo-hydrolase [Spirochaetes bacterium]|nr:MBL fold metallo-hydrolase [Spirochaetota bacterium]
MNISFTLIGQATVVMDIDGVVFMTDPWWGSFEFLRAVPIVCDPEGISPLHYMLVSHNHIDHWCNRAIALAKEKNCTVIGSIKAIKRAKKRGVKNLKALTPGESVDCNGIIVGAVPAFHPFAKDAIGFIVQKGNVTLYFSGDTLYTENLRKALTPYSVTIAMIQVACSTYPLVGKDGMDLEAAARFVAEVKPEMIIPIHYQIKGKYCTDAQLQNWDVGAQKIILPHGREFHLKL